MQGRTTASTVGTAPPATPGARRRAALLQAGKILASIGLLALLIASVGPRDIGRTLAAVQPPRLVLPFALILVDQSLRILAWRILLRARGYTPTPGRLAYGFFTGTFLGSFLPSSLGTDATRAVAISRLTRVPLAEAASSVIVLSLFGLFAMCLVATASSLLMLVRGDAMAVTNFVLLFALTFIAVMVMLRHGHLPRAAMALLSRRRLTRAAGTRLERWYEVLHAYASSGALRSITGLTIVNQCINIIWNYAVALALGLQIPFLYFVLVIPIVMVGKLVPLTFMGFGVEQGYFAYLFGQLGVPAAEAVAISLLVASCNVVYNLFCGAIHVAGSLNGALHAAWRRPPPADAPTPVD